MDVSERHPAGPGQVAGIYDAGLVARARILSPSSTSARRPSRVHRWGGLTRRLARRLSAAAEMTNRIINAMRRDQYALIRDGDGDALRFPDSLWTVSHPGQVGGDKCWARRARCGPFSMKRGGINDDETTTENAECRDATVENSTDWKAMARKWEAQSKANHASCRA